MSVGDAGYDAILKHREKEKHGHTSKRQVFFPSRSRNFRVDLQPFEFDFQSFRKSNLYAYLLYDISKQ